MFRRKERVRTIATPNQVDSGALAAARSLGKALKSDGKSVDYAKLPKYNAPSRSGSMLGLNNVVSSPSVSRRYSLTNEPGVNIRNGPRSSGSIRGGSNVRRYQSSSDLVELPRASSLPSVIGNVSGGSRITRKQRQEAQDTFQEFGGSQARRGRTPVIRRKRNDERRLSVQRQQSQLLAQQEPPTIKKFVPGRNGLMAVEIPNPNYRPPAETRQAGGTLRRSTSLQANLGLRARRVSSVISGNQMQEPQFRDDRSTQKGQRRASSLTSSGNNRREPIKRKPRMVSAAPSSALQQTVTANRVSRTVAQTASQRGTITTIKNANDINNSRSNSNSNNSSTRVPRQPQAERTLDPEAQSPTSSHYSTLSSLRPLADHSISSSQFSTPLITTTVPEESEFDLQEDQLFDLDNIAGTADSSFLHYGQVLGTVPEVPQQDMPILDSNVIQEIRGEEKQVRAEVEREDVQQDKAKYDDDDEVDKVSITIIDEDKDAEEAEESEGSTDAEESDVIRPIVAESAVETPVKRRSSPVTETKSDNLGPETTPNSPTAVINGGNKGPKEMDLGQLEPNTLSAPAPATNSTPSSVYSSTQPLALPGHEDQEESEGVSTQHPEPNEQANIAGTDEPPPLGNLVSRIMTETPDRGEVFSTPLQETPTRPLVNPNLGSDSRENLMRQLKLEEKEVITNMLEDLRNIHEQPGPLEEHSVTTNVAVHSRARAGTDVSEQISLASSDAIRDVRGSVERIIGRIDAVGSGSAVSSRHNTPLASKSKNSSSNYELSSGQGNGLSPERLESPNLAQTLRSANPYLSTGGLSGSNFTDALPPPPPIISYDSSIENLTTPTRKHPLMTRSDKDAGKPTDIRANNGANSSPNRLPGPGTSKNSSGRLVTPIKSAMKKTSTPSSGQADQFADDSPALHAYLSLTTAENTRLNAQIAGDEPQPIRQTVPRKVVRPQSMVSSIQRKNVPTGRAMEQKKIKRHSSIERSSSQSKVMSSRHLIGSNASIDAKQPGVSSATRSQIARPTPASARQATKHLSMISGKPQAPKSATRAAMLSHKMAEDRNSQQDDLNDRALAIVKNEMDLNAILYPMEPLEKKSSFQKSHHTDNGVAFKHMSLRDQAFISSGSLTTDQPSGADHGRSTNWTSRFNDSDSDDEGPIKKMGFGAKMETKPKKSSNFSLFKSRDRSGSYNDNARPPQYMHTGSSPLRSVSTPLKSATPKVQLPPSPSRATSEMTPRTADGGQQQPRHHHTLGLSLGKSHSNRQSNVSEQEEVSPRRKQGLSKKLKKLFGRRKSEY